MKKRLFVAGLVSGLVLSRTWRVLTKEGIKVGIRGGRKLNELAQEFVEDVQDVTAEALEELSAREQPEAD